MASDSVLIAGGGTGGHIYPGLAVADQLRRRRPHVPVLWVGTRTGLERELVPGAGYPLLCIRSGGIAGKAWPVRLVNALLVPVGTLQSARIVMRTRARVVMGVGGYASGPVVMAARLLRRRTLVLEQNASPGATNRILAPLVDRVAVSFPSTAARLPGRVTVTGNPVRTGFEEIPDRRSPERRTVLVFGGSRGARGLNDAVIETLPAWAAAGLPVEFIHQTGRDDEGRVRAAYQQAGLPARVAAYIHDMAAAYAVADLVVCRAGATTVAELSAAGRAAVLVPLPHAAGGHQDDNARALAEVGAAVVVPQAEAGSGRLGTLVLELLRDPKRRRDMEAAVRALGAPRAAAAVADIVLELYELSNRESASGNGRPR